MLSKGRVDLRETAGGRAGGVQHVSRGGHFIAFEQPELFVEEVRAGFRAIRASLTG
jgi:pimeloyl-ACP methyl ester carboxylesterase